MAQVTPADATSSVHLTLPGTAALDPFRLERRLARIRERADAVEGLEARFVYYLDCDREPTETERERLAIVLNDGAAPAAFDHDGFEVAPRAGTISP